MPCSSCGKRKKATRPVRPEGLAIHVEEPAATEEELEQEEAHSE